ncbi:MAG: hypothetical protein PHX70_09570 [Clostridium sp.]|nr:hypothetical protein [Clostridium sp.]
MIKKLIETIIATLLAILLALPVPVLAIWSNTPISFPGEINLTPVYPQNISNAPSQVDVGYNITYETNPSNSWTAAQTTTAGTNISSAGISGSASQVPNVTALRMSIIGSNIPNNASSTTYEVSTVNNGWQEAQTTSSGTGIVNASITGNVGQSTALNGIKITLNNMPGYAVTYQTYVQNLGWTNIATTESGTPIANASIAGNINKSLPITAVRITIEKSTPYNFAQVSSNGSSIGTNNPLVVTANNPAAVTISNVDINGNVIPVTSSEANNGTSVAFALQDSNGGSFYASSNGPQIQYITIPVGSSSATVYYKNSTNKSITGNIAAVTPLNTGITFNSWGTVTAGREDFYTIGLKGDLQDFNGTLPISITGGQNNGNQIPTYPTTATFSYGEATILIDLVNTSPQTLTATVNNTNSNVSVTPVEGKNSLLSINTKSLILSAKNKVYYNGKLLNPNTVTYTQGTAIAKYFSAIEYNYDGEIVIFFTPALSSELSSSATILKNIKSTLTSEISRNQNALNLNNIASIGGNIENAVAQLNSSSNNYNGQLTQNQKEMIQWETAQAIQQSSITGNPISSCAHAPALSPNLTLAANQVAKCIIQLILSVFFA